jgi:hypothetical protein
VSLTPIVRYMILCNDWGLDPENENRVNIYGILSNISPVDVPAYPLVQAEMCVFLSLTELRGSGNARRRCVFQVTGELIFQTAAREIQGGVDRLEIIGVPFRIVGGLFPQPGFYAIQFWYNDVLMHECPLQLRRSP